MQGILQGNCNAWNTYGAGKLILTINGNENQITFPMIPVETAIKKLRLSINGNGNIITLPMAGNGLDYYKILEVSGNGNLVNGKELVDPMMQDLGFNNVYVGQPGYFVQVNGNYQTVGYIGGQYVVNQGFYVQDANQNTLQAVDFDMPNLQDEDGTTVEEVASDSNLSDEDEEQNVEAAPDEEQNVEAVPDEEQNVEAVPDEEKNAQAVPDEEKNAQAVPDEEQNVQAVSDEEQNVQEVPYEEQNVQAIPVEEIEVLREHNVSLQGNGNFINVLDAGFDDGNEVRRTSDIIQGNGNSINIAMRF